MKKRYVLLIGVLALVTLAAAGCGKKKDSSADGQDAQATVTPAADSEEASQSDDNLIDMQESTAEDISNVMGEKTDTSTKVIFVNSTGSEVSKLYVRPHVTDGDDSEWGEDLIQGMFKLKNSDKALYYFEASEEDSSGNVPSSYDIRIVYTDENLSECYFRDIPLQNITQITLRMDGTGDSSIPYATYTQGSSRQEISTLAAVKKRLGLDDESGESDETETTPTPAAETTPTSAPSQVTPTPTSNSDDNTNTDPTDSGAELAKTFIGKSLDELEAACGEPTGSDYQNEPETGETGYHYYSTFTVSTMVDADGNEVVSGVW